MSRMQQRGWDDHEPRACVGGVLAPHGGAHRPLAGVRTRSRAADRGNTLGLLTRAGRSHLMEATRARGNAHFAAVAGGRRVLLVLGVVALMTVATASPAVARIDFRKDRLAQPRGQAPPVTRLLVQFRQNTDEARREGIARDAGGRLALRLRLVRALAVAPRQGVTLEELRARLRASDRVQRVEDDGPIAISKNANDPGVSEQYAIKQKDDHDIDAPGAWNERTGCATVAVLDTGVQTDHPD